MLKKLTLLRDRVSDCKCYPFAVPAIRELDEIVFRSRICFFAGENGTGKSTLLEAIAAHYGFGREGGNRNFRNDSTESNHSIDPLVKALRLSFDLRTGAGFFLRAESFFNTASHIDSARRASPATAHRSLATLRRADSLHTSLARRDLSALMLDCKLRRNGLFLLDEPEAALSPQRPLFVPGPDYLRRCCASSRTRSSSSPRTRRCCSPTPKAQNSSRSTKRRVREVEDQAENGNVPGRAPLPQPARAVASKDCSRKRPSLFERRVSLVREPPSCARRAAEGGSSHMILGLAKS